MSQPFISLTDRECGIGLEVSALKGFVGLLYALSLSQPDILSDEEEKSIALTADVLVRALDRKVLEIDQVVREKLGTLPKIA